ncbi:DUF4244 domain-containing protein [Lihuaxuella thermophila]|uniref:Uncharacterized protein n=1 Tax=Lihuaxuella thermophila TaxID=1173111 RepID=A0A1H8I3T6_9BACL|nr:DUF4244 domain-containing protein [Lihuaxuella thermophila]SEN63149.1 Protein of unknown function [Lihuaxuella thermophila]
MKNLKNKLNEASIRMYVAYKNIFSSKKGSSTVEYVIVLAAAAAFAGVLATVLSGEAKGYITKKISEALK